MLFQSKKSHRGVETKFLLNNNKKTSSVLTFPSLNVLSTSNIELIDNPCPAPNRFLNNSLPHELMRLEIQTKKVKVLTQSNGYPRVIKVIEIALGDKILKMTDMFTSLPLGLNDALNSMISNNGNQENEVLNFSLLLENKQGNENILSSGLNQSHVANGDEATMQLDGISEEKEKSIDNKHKLLKLSRRSKAIKKQKRKTEPLEEDKKLPEEEQYNSS